MEEGGQAAREHLFLISSADRAITPRRWNNARPLGPLSPMSDEAIDELKTAFGLGDG